MLYDSLSTRIIKNEARIKNGVIKTKARNQ